ncbi:MAG: c-type cytochrome [Comamonadaceae bacterium]|nr:c-type cytochrome [Pseudomonadota bacterium]MBS0609534.1 c-type cytochrome [Pseudomonadota bacterium]MDE2415288.1 c-type cytochrome [Comamonadaceae bacterium]
MALAPVLGAWLLLACVPAVAQSVERGRTLYESRCSACHSVDANRTGPMHAGVLERRAGSVPGFNYSPALASSRIVWTRANLLAWLANPEALIPGQAMGYQVPDARDREDLVAYLATLGAPAPR